MHIYMTINKSLTCTISSLGRVVIGSVSLAALYASYPSVAIIIWTTLLARFTRKSSFLKYVEKESVVVMPAFGVQLETHYGSGRIIRRFVPVGKIVKPLLNECVTPLTCYWTLSLFLQDEEELMLVFKELRPPVKMLVPIWKSLCALTDSVESSDTYQEEP